eukprot:TRINITY_DN1942_c0_g1_i1.p2 TRINITY_DN1942_c0_g1~~TRINITY_DN1942_c0_g1_i1.p2  ORF type:complete len:134 (+),score=19.08 TRINITY_DN1942_c0_g1_i1:292-693(+)
MTEEPSKDHSELKELVRTNNSPCKSAKVINPKLLNSMEKRNKASGVEVESNCSLRTPEKFPAKKKPALHALSKAIRKPKEPNKSKKTTKDAKRAESSIVQRSKLRSSAKKAFAQTSCSKGSMSICVVFDSIIK